MSASPDFAAASMAADKLPLTAWQKARLIGECVPFLFFVVVTVLYLTVLRNIVGAPPLFFFLLLSLVLLGTGYTARKRRRDLASGVALVQEDRLQRLRRSGSGRGGSTLYGEFEKLGKLRMMPKAYHHSHAGFSYRVCYSPASKIVWSLEQRG